MANEVLGVINCPLCGNPDATVHRQGGRRVALYYRCYETTGSMNAVCGTIQCTGPKGQEIIARLMAGKTVEPKAQTEPEKLPARPLGQTEPAPPSVKQSFLNKFMAGDDEE